MYINCLSDEIKKKTPPKNLKYMFPLPIWNPFSLSSTGISNHYYSFTTKP